MKIVIINEGGLTDEQIEIFKRAAAYWENTILDNIKLIINANAMPIDGMGTSEGNILGQAGPTDFYLDGLPSHGMMSYDTADLAKMEKDGSLETVVRHEIAHLIGFGTIWKRRKLIRGFGTKNPTFIGKKAKSEYGKLLETVPRSVPVSNTGGAGTYGSHWREDIFYDELMTGYVNYAGDPISRLTLASLEDLGYEINYSKAEQYILPAERRESLVVRALYRDVVLPEVSVT